jgi:Skp family chaperone for outer membrane proteins
MNKLLFGAALAALSLGMPTAVSAQRAPAATIVVVDTDRILRDCTACRAAQTNLTSQIQQLQQRAQSLGAPLQTEAQAIQTAAQALQSQQGAARTTAENALRTRAQALETRQNNANQEINRAEQNLQSIRANVVRQINERLLPIINQVMTQRNANLAVDTGATLARAQALDVTDAVLALLNQQLPSVSLTPLPQQAAPAGQPQGR